MHNFDCDHSSRCLFSRKPRKIRGRHWRHIAAGSTRRPIAASNASREQSCRAAKKEPRRSGAEKSRSEDRSVFTRRLVPIPAQGVGVRDAHVAASVRAGGGMPFKRLVCLCGPLDVVGRRTGARSIDHPTVRRGPSRRAPARIATGSSLLGIRLGRSHLCGGIGLRRRRGWRHLLGIRLHHPGRRNQNGHACNGDQSAFHRLPPFFGR